MIMKNLKKINNTQNLNNNQNVNNINMNLLVMKIIKILKT